MAQSRKMKSVCCEQALHFLREERVTTYSFDFTLVYLHLVRVYIYIYKQDEQMNVQSNGWLAFEMNENISIERYSVNGKNLREEKREKIIIFSYSRKLFWEWNKGSLFREIFIYFSTKLDRFLTIGFSKSLGFFFSRLMNHIISK